MALGSALLLLQLVATATPPDAQLLRSAREEQVRFESVRRQHVPIERSSSGGCDAHTSLRVGRYCYWHDPTDRPVEREPKAIVHARARLLAFLDSAVALAPADPWLAGQRTRYLIEEGRPDAAAEAARLCRSERWWCAALEGLSLHVARRYAEADSVYEVALDSMPADLRCEWFDITAAIAGRLARELGRAGCQERAATASRLWRISRPLWSTPGNDLRSEHFARHTMAEILTRSANAHGMRWSGDSQELLLRYGWAEWFTRQRDDMTGIYASPRLTGHDREPSYQFFPLVESGKVKWRLTADSWRLSDPLALTRYAPRHVKRLSPLPHQLARFPRGDSMLIAIAYRITDTALARDSGTAWILTASQDGDKPSVRDRRRTTGDRGVLAGTIGRDSAVASVEVLGDSTMHAARARYSVDPLPCRGSWCVSDLLLYDATSASSADQVEAVLLNAAAELRFSNRGPLGVFWEVQGVVERPVPVWVSLTVSRVRVNLARRFASRLHLAPELAPVRLRWQSTLLTSRDGQQITLRLPRNARGRYRVQLSVEGASMPLLSARRDIEVLP